MGTVQVWSFCSPVLGVFLELSFISYVKTIDKYLAFDPSTGTKAQIYSEMRK
jgi:putative Mn2+ efflux pump MntP